MGEARSGLSPPAFAGAGPVRWRTEGECADPEEGPPHDEGPGAPFGIVGRTTEIAEIVSLVRKVAASNATAVLLEGESGSGKDLVARAIHSASARKDNPFMEINCAAIPENLLESELVGHEQGAFTGARSRKLGLFELADGGTVFLDEISELRLDLQVKLLRLVETRRFKRVGGVEEIKVDARIIAATNRSLESAVQDGRFREDLYYRLKVIPIRVPALRERRDDIPRLVDHFVSRFNTEFGKRVRGVSPEALELLGGYAWPGNVRELKNVIERAIILGDDDVIRARHLPMEVRDPESAPSGPCPPAAGLRLTQDGINLEELERSLLKQGLELTGGNQVRAARLLGLGRDALRYRMKKYGLFRAYSRRSRGRGGGRGGGGRRTTREADRAEDGSLVWAVPQGPLP
jgi:transcriptional regulator with PAS, ATPase and Fis domain